LRGGSVVQVGAFSSKANAEASAAKVGGHISPAGRLWRVRMGPYAAPAEAAAALAKAKGAGYSDARIQRAD
jgi:cell division protein FtsN